MRPGKKSAVAIIAELKSRILRRNAMDPELMPTNRLMERWAVSVGGGLPTKDWDDSPRSRPPPLDDETAVKIDRIVQALRPRQHRLAVLWWKTPTPAEAVASELGLSSRSNIYPHVNGLLQYLRGRFHGAGIDC